MPQIRGVAHKTTQFGFPSTNWDDTTALQPSILFTPGLAEEYDGVDTGTGLITLTPSLTAEEHDIFDTGTALITLTPSEADVAGFIDAVTAFLALTPALSSEIYTSPYLFRDTFTRTVAGGSLNWGTADFGGTWVGDGSSVFSVDGSHGVITLFESVGEVVTPDLGTDQVDVFLTFGCDAAALASDLVYQVLFRNGNTSVFITFVDNGDGTYEPILHAFDTVGGNSNFVADGISITPGGPLFLNLRMRIASGAISAKMWPYGESEPPDVWQVVQPIGSSAAVYRIGIQAGSSTYAHTINWYTDNLLVYSNTVQNLTDEGTPTITLTPASSDKEAAVDVSTGLLVLTPSAIDIGPINETGTALLVLTPQNLSEEYDGIDAPVALLNLSAAFLEGNTNLTSTGTAIIDLTPHMADNEYDGIDAQTIVLLLTPNSLEFKGQLPDTLLDGILEGRILLGVLEPAKYYANRNQ